MTKLQIISDLHQEFSPIEITNAGADILILAGDIVVAERFTRSAESSYNAQALEWQSWFETVCAQFEQVIYIAGNHEHYNGYFYQTIGILRDALGYIPNLHILDDQHVDLGDTRFLCGTLWTDFDHNNLHALNVRDGMNDYKVIKGQHHRRLTTGETAIKHQNLRRLIEAEKHEKIIVVSHHAPSYRSVADRHRTGNWAHLNHGYFSHLDNLILDKNNQIKLWIHGHTHDSHDYHIGDTRIVCNPRGYQKHLKLPPENQNFDPNLIVEIA